MDYEITGHDERVITELLRAGKIVTNAQIGDSTGHCLLVSKNHIRYLGLGEEGFSYYAGILGTDINVIERVGDNLEITEYGRGFGRFFRTINVATWEEQFHPDAYAAIVRNPKFETVH